ncbi:MAG TPA: PhzF family phenazine biosynthesis protein [Symbiobacteriaceae bacterium]|nr:PhzF family phenazine biosynthesis protein [Symbiobacteriaceae bacterium]
MPHLPFAWVDVFADRPLAGNQLAVFTVPDDFPVALMERLARELNHSETAFLQPATAPGAGVRVRIFLPTLPHATEIPFAGHPILGSACVAAMDTREPQRLQVETGAGVLPVWVTPAGPGHWEARMAQPLPAVTGVVEAREELALALGLAPGDLRGGLPVEAVDNGMQTVLIPLASREAVQRARPDLPRLRDLLGRAGLCTLVFAMGGVESGSDVHCRVFGPFDIVPEDPATGSANGPLGEYLVRHGLSPGPVVQSEQGFAIGRPSLLTVTVERRDGVTQAVYVSGAVRLVGRGEFELPQQG